MFAIKHGQPNSVRDGKFCCASHSPVVPSASFDNELVPDITKSDSVFHQTLQLGTKYVQLISSIDPAGRLMTEHTDLTSYWIWFSRLRLR